MCSPIIAGVALSVLLLPASRAMTATAETLSTSCSRADDHVSRRRRRHEAGTRPVPTGRGGHRPGHAAIATLLPAPASGADLADDRAGHRGGAGPAALRAVHVRYRRQP